MSIIVASLGFNFLGQLCFYCPCLIVHARKVAQNKNSLFCCIYRPDVIGNGLQSPKTQVEENNSTGVMLENGGVLMSSQEPSQNKQTKNKKKLKNLIENLSFYKFNFLYNTKFKYAISILFACYFVANAFVCGFKLKIDIPISELLPTESYLAKHMKYHLRDFDLGPMIMLNFMKPFNASDSQKINKIIQFVDDAKQLDGIAEFEINLLRNFQQTQKSLSEFYPGNPSKVSAINNLFIMYCLSRQFSLISR